jgi:hypothetical protein
MLLAVGGILPPLKQSLRTVSRDSVNLRPRAVRQHARQREQNARAPQISCRFIARLQIQFLA